MGNKDFLGVGMKFPPQIDPGTGRFMVSSQGQNVRESVYLILMTNRGERWLQPGFGSSLAEYTFMDTSVTMLRLLSDELKNIILEQEPRISTVEIDIDGKSQEGCLLIDIEYTLAASNARENMVFPFYLKAMGEGG